jgi:hypothetical protein
LKDTTVLFFDELHMQWFAQPMVVAAHSYLMNSPMYDNKDGWKESTAVGCLVAWKKRR